MADNISILIADDDSFLLDMYSIKFNKEGFKVEAVASAQEALSKIEEGFVPQVCLFDIVMPEMTGLELVAAMREKNLAPEAVVIMLTNQAEKENIDKAKELGVTGYIVKATTVPSEVVTEVRKMYQEKLNK